MRMVTVVPDDAGHAVERHRVVRNTLSSTARSTIRTSVRQLSVLTLLSAVSGVVVLTHQGSARAGVQHNAQAAQVGQATQATQAIGMMRQSELIRSAAAQRSSRSSVRVSALESAAAIKAEATWMHQARMEGYKDLRRRYLVIKAARDATARKAAAHARAAAEARAFERVSRSARRDPKAMARVLLADRGWSGQFSCLDSLWTRESRWNYRAANPSSGAYGIPQALPGGKMSSAGPDWRTNPVTQMKWGLGYIADRYGSPCGAWSHSQSSGWY